MQRETALVLFGVGLVLLLLIVGAALYVASPPQPQPVSETERTPTVTPTAPPTFPPTQTVSPISPPAIVTPSLPPPAYAATPTVAPTYGKETFTSLPAPLPPTPSPQLPSSSHLPQAKPGVAIHPETEALRWAQALVATYRPRWRINLTRGVDPSLRGESYAVTVEPNNQVTVEAKTDVGWLYGLLDLAERLQWREPIPAQWRWSPPSAERGLVVENPEWLMRTPRSQEALRNLLRERLKELAWWRFNNLVIKCNGNEANLSRVLHLLKQMAPDYGVKVVVWAKVLSPSLQTWLQQGGQAATDFPAQGNFITVTTDLNIVANQIAQGKVAGFKFQLVAPNIPSTVLQFRRNREKLSLVVGLDEAYREVFWFDPAWAHQFVRLVADAGLGGIWLTVASTPPTWAITAFAQAFKNPNADGEAIWINRWAKQGHQADKWLVLFREASRIVAEISWLGISPQPQYGASLKSFFIARPIDSSWGFTVLSVPETLKLVRRPDDRTTLTTDEIARRLEQRASSVWALTAQLPEPAASDWKAAKRLALLNSWLGQFYANKIDAALAWGRFEEGDQTAGQECLLHLTKSVKAWEQVVNLANTVYRPNNRWALRLLEWQRELAEYQALVAGTMP